MSEESLQYVPPVEFNDPARPRDLAERVKGGIQIMHVAWGLTWLVGNGLFFLSNGPGGHVFVTLPSWLPLTVLFLMLAAAGVTTVILGIRVFGHGATDATFVRQAKWYGTAWLLGFAGLLITVGKVTHGLSTDEQGLIWAATTTGLAAALNLAGSAIWLDRAQFRLGIWLTLVNVVGAIAGQGWQSLIVSVAGGGVILYLGCAGILAHRKRPAMPSRSLA
jgi:hypothetical protein